VFFRKSAGGPSSGGWGGGTDLACQSLLAVLMNFGFLVFGVTDYAGKLRPGGKTVVLGDPQHKITLRT
jgi:hypothetical protein